MFRPLVGTAAKLNGNIFCFILGNYFPYAHTYTHTLCAHAHTQAVRHMHRPHSDTNPQGDFSGILLKAPGRFSDMLSLWEAIEMLGTLSNLWTESKF